MTASGCVMHKRSKMTRLSTHAFVSQALASVIGWLYTVSLAGRVLIARRGERALRAFR